MYVCHSVSGKSRWSVNAHSKLFNIIPAETNHAVNATFVCNAPVFRVSSSKNHCADFSGKSRWMCTVSKMTYVVLCIFVVAFSSQLSRLAELGYVATSVSSLTASRATPADATSHLSNSSGTFNSSETLSRLLTTTHASRGLQR